MKSRLSWNRGIEPHSFSPVPGLPNHESDGFTARSTLVLQIPLGILVDSDRVVPPMAQGYQSAIVRPDVLPPAPSPPPEFDHIASESHTNPSSSSMDQLAALRAVLVCTLQQEIRPLRSDVTKIHDQLVSMDSRLQNTELTAMQASSRIENLESKIVELDKSTDSRLSAFESKIGFEGESSIDAHARAKTDQLEQRLHLLSIGIAEGSRTAASSSPSIGLVPRDSPHRFRN